MLGSGLILGPLKEQQQRRLVDLSHGSLHGLQLGDDFPETRIYIQHGLLYRLRRPQPALICI